MSQAPQTNPQAQKDQAANQSKDKINPATGKPDMKGECSTDKNKDSSCATGNKPKASNA